MARSIVRSLLFLLLFLGTESSFAQLITGYVKDAQNQALPFVSIALVHAKDSSLLAATLSDTVGYFEFKTTHKGLLYVKAQYIGYKTVRSSEFQFSKENVILGNLILNESLASLDEVQIVAKKVLVEQEAGKTTLNIENSVVASSGLMASDVLKRTPGVVMDNDGNITLKGKDKVLLLIDDKPLYLSAKQAYAILKGIPSSQISKIEVITSPSAKYDAAGNAGVINIILKKGVILGWNGGFHTSVGTGYYPKSNLGFTISYGGAKSNASASYDLTGNQDFNRYVQKRNFGRLSDGNILQQDQTYFVPSLSHSFRLKYDYDISKKWKIGLTQRTLYIKDTWIGKSKTQILDPSQNVSQTIDMSDHNPSTVSDVGGGINASFSPDTSRKKWTMDLDYARFEQQAVQKSYTDITSPTGAFRSFGYNYLAQVPTQVQTFTGKLDYYQPLAKNLTLEVGAKGIGILVDSRVRYDMDSLFPSKGFLTSGTFLYQENILAAYANLSWQYGNLSVSAGLRPENWSVRGKMAETNLTIRRDSLLFFPSGNIKYKLNTNQELGFSYANRIDRPNYRTLNPTAFYGDPYNYFMGNPKLKPQFTHHMELSHSLWEGALMTTLNYTHSRSFIAEYVIQQANDSTLIQSMSPLNFPTVENLGISVSLYYPVTPWWTCMVYVNGYQNRVSGKIFDQNFYLTQFSALLNTSQSFTLPKNWSLEIQGLYISPTLDGYTTNRSMGMVSLGLLKSFWNQQGQLKLAVQDATYSFIFRGNSTTETLTNSYSYQWDNRLVTLTFSYKFGLKNLLSPTESTENNAPAIKGGGPR